MRTISSLHSWQVKTVSTAHIRSLTNRHGKRERRKAWDGKRGRVMRRTKEMREEEGRAPKRAEKDMIHFQLLPKCEPCFWSQSIVVCNENTASTAIKLYHLTHCYMAGGSTPTMAGATISKQ